MADRLGQQFGNYRLIALLGQGSYAEVYLGQHVRLELSCHQGTAWAPFQQ